MEADQPVILESESEQHLLALTACRTIFSPWLSSLIEGMSWVQTKALARSPESPHRTSQRHCLPANPKLALLILIRVCMALPSASMQLRFRRDNRDILKTTAKDPA